MLLPFLCAAHPCRCSPASRRPERINRDKKLPTGKGFRLKVPLAFLGCKSALLFKRDDQKPLAPGESEILRHCQITRVVGPYETRITSFNVGPTRDAKHPRCGIAHGHFIGRVDLCDTLPVRRCSAVEAPPNRKVIGPRQLFHWTPACAQADRDETSWRRVGTPTGLIVTTSSMHLRNGTCESDGQGCGCALPAGATSSRPFIPVQAHGMKTNADCRKDRRLTASAPMAASGVWFSVEGNHLLGIW